MWVPVSMTFLFLFCHLARILFGAFFTFDTLGLILALIQAFYRIFDILVLLRASWPGRRHSLEHIWFDVNNHRLSSVHKIYLLCVLLEANIQVRFFGLEFWWNWYSSNLRLLLIIHIFLLIWRHSHMFTTTVHLHVLVNLGHVQDFRIRNIFEISGRMHRFRICLVLILIRIPFLSALLFLGLQFLLLFLPLEVFV